MQIWPRFGTQFIFKGADKPQHLDLVTTLETLLENGNVPTRLVTCERSTSIKIITLTHQDPETPEQKPNHVGLSRQNLTRSTNATRVQQEAKVMKAFAQRLNDLFPDSPLARQAKATAQALDTTYLDKIELDMTGLTTANPALKPKRPD